MAGEMKCFRCWYKDGSARMLDAADHRSAAGTAMELASIDNADLDRTKPEQKAEYLNRCRVIKTECLTDGSVQKWKA